VETPRYGTGKTIDKIDEAIASGDLEPLTGTGRPIPNLTRDPDWWVRAFLNRERHADQVAQITSHRTSTVAAAIAAEGLAEARELIANLNSVLDRWNNDAPEEFHLDPVSEIWLITERAKVPGR
jgi:hypothetical protein